VLVTAASPLAELHQLHGQITTEKHLLHLATSDPPRQVTAILTATPPHLGPLRPFASNPGALGQEAMSPIWPELMRKRSEVQDLADPARSALGQPAVPGQLGDQSASASNRQRQDWSAPGFALARFPLQN
jgi:hypothetical protein